MRIYFLAENRRHFDYWLRHMATDEERASRPTYVHDDRKLCGIDGDDIVILEYETFWRLPPHTGLAIWDRVKILRARGASVKSIRSLRT